MRVRSTTLILPQGAGLWSIQNKSVRFKTKNEPVVGRNLRNAILMAISSKIFIDGISKNSLT